MEQRQRIFHCVLRGSSQKQKSLHVIDGIDVEPGAELLAPNAARVKLLESLSQHAVMTPGHPIEKRGLLSIESDQIITAVKARAQNCALLRSVKSPSFRFLDSAHDMLCQTGLSGKFFFLQVGKRLSKIPQRHRWQIAADEHDPSMSCSEKRRKNMLHTCAELGAALGKNFAPRRRQSPD